MVGTAIELQSRWSVNDSGGKSNTSNPSILISRNISVDSPGHGIILFQALIVIIDSVVTADLIRGQARNSADAGDLIATPRIKRFPCSRLEPGELRQTGE
jgi:hypothetical protein